MECLPSVTIVLLDIIFNNGLFPIVSAILQNTYVKFEIAET